jgi:hypothetical protein
VVGSCEHSNKSSGFMKAGNFLKCKRTVRFSRKTLFHRFILLVLRQFVTKLLFNLFTSKIFANTETNNFRSYYTSCHSLCFVAHLQLKFFAKTQKCTHTKNVYRNVFNVGVKKEKNKL